MRKQLPLTGNKLENFILNHIRVYAEDYILNNQDDFDERLYLSDVMEQEMGAFLDDLRHTWSKKREELVKAGV